MRCVVRGCVMRGCVVRGCVMRGCVVRGCVMRGCVVRGCVVRGYVMRGCVVRGYVDAEVDPPLLPGQGLGSVVDFCGAKRLGPERTRVRCGPLLPRVSRRLRPPPLGLQGRRLLSAFKAVKS